MAGSLKERERPTLQEARVRQKEKRNERERNKTEREER